MGLLNNYTGIGMSPRPKWKHQHVISHAVRYSYDELEDQGLFMLSEATVTDDWDDLAPDLVIFDAHNKPLSIIEITTHRECSEIVRKCYDLMTRFPDTEYFVYDYEKNVLYAYDAQTQDWVNSTEYEIGSHYLQQPLIEYLLP